MSDDGHRYSLNSTATALGEAKEESSISGDGHSDIGSRFQAEEQDHRRHTATTVADDSSSSSSTSSSNDSWGTEEEESSRITNNEQLRRPSSSEDSELHVDAAATSTALVPVHSATPSPSGSSTAASDQERQILLLMLLAQVCAWHDPTPRTFTVHVLELFERGLLDRTSLQFLYDQNLGILQPPHPATTNVPSPSSLSPNNRRLLTYPTSSSAAATEEQPETSHDHHQQRSVEASAIRMSLAQQEQEHHERTWARQQPHNPMADANASRKSSSFAAEHHPLSLSRYQREFEQIRLLAQGAFGQVYEVKNEMDGQRYAMKRVLFGATGLGTQSILDRVIREVHCLAVCDHPHVVRYYTSWLEPSWMTGTSASSSNGLDMLTNHLHVSDAENEGSSPQEKFQSYFSEQSADASSWGNDDVSEWTVDDDRNTRAMHNDDLDQPCHSPLSHKTASVAPSTYRYQICLFIQMQLCHPFTLADWIRKRNHHKHQQQQDSETAFQERLATTSEIFGQIVSGLAHVHGRGIVHRDLKPANIFASSSSSHHHGGNDHQPSFQFKIGDFGLSKIVDESAHNRTGSAATCSTGDTDRTVSPRAGASSPRSNNVLSIELDNMKGIHKDEHAGERNDSYCQELLTAGVGTASYAAPEQVASRSYGDKADIFSIGLVLLELLCIFSTEHERLQTFQNCRQHRMLPDELSHNSCPEAVRQTVLTCTEPNPNRRPSAQELLNVEFSNMQRGDSNASTISAISASESSNAAEIKALRSQLSEKNKQLEQHKKDLADKDQTINELRREVSRLKRETEGHASNDISRDPLVHYSFSATTTSPPPRAHRHENLTELDSASTGTSNTSSSEDEL